MAPMHTCGVGVVAFQVRQGRRGLNVLVVPHDARMRFDRPTVCDTEVPEELLSLSLRINAVVPVGALYRLFSALPSHRSAHGVAIYIVSACLVPRTPVCWRRR